MSALRIAIRPEEPTDQEPIQRIHLDAFRGPEEARIVDDIRGTADWLDGGSIVATDDDGALVGHALLSRGVLRRDGREWEIGMIGPIAVLPGVQRRGVGAALMAAAIERAEELRLPVLCLLGHADYYPRFGFVPARSIGIEPPRDWADANWLALPLSEMPEGLRGVAHYPPAFGIG